MKNTSKTLKEITAKEVLDKQTKAELQSILKELAPISSAIINAGNKLRDLTAHRGKDMSQWRHQKGAGSELAKKFVEKLHPLGQKINSHIMLAGDELIEIEREIEKLLGK